MLTFAEIGRGGEMKTWIPYIITAVLSLVIGMLLMRQCSEPKEIRVPGETKRDTLYLVKADTVYKTRTRTEYVRPTRPFAPDDDCSEQLAECSSAYDEAMLQVWLMSSIEATGEKRLPWGTVKAEFSMLRYATDMQDGFRFTATREYADTTTTQYVYRDPWYDRIGAGPYIGYGYPAGWSTGVAVTYTFFRPSDIWR
jgi:hypothetical protein